MPLWEPDRTSVCAASQTDAPPRRGSDFLIAAERQRRRAEEEEELRETRCSLTGSLLLINLWKTTSVCQKYIKFNRLKLFELNLKC